MIKIYYVIRNFVLTVLLIAAVYMIDWYYRAGAKYKRFLEKRKERMRHTTENARYKPDQYDWMAIIYSLVVPICITIFLSCLLSFSLYYAFTDHNDRIRDLEEMNRALIQRVDFMEYRLATCNSD